MLKLLSKLKTYTYYFLTPLSPRWCSKFLYWRAFKRRLDLRNPVTLNEKLMWLKLNRYRDDRLVASCTDKYAVREYVKSCGCGEILNELYGVWESPNEIDWDALPQSFVLKCNHASGFNIICKDKETLDIDACKKRLGKWLRRGFWRYSAELQYRHIPRRIVGEKLLGHHDVPADYKIYCFHGKPVCTLACCQREQGWPRFYFFDSDWNLMRLTKDGKKAAPDFTLPRPTHFSEMMEYARRLSTPFPFVRVDLYDTEDGVVFGELTFTPSACLDTDRLPETDLMLGKLLDLDL